MPSKSRRLIAGLLMLGVAGVLVRAGYVRFLGMSPTYHKCLAAMDSVVVGQSWSEAETSIAHALTSGGRQWQAGDDPLPDTVGEPFPASSGSVWVTCVRYQPDLSTEIDDHQKGILLSYRVWAQATRNGGFNYTMYELVHEDGAVASVRARDCSIWPVDTVDCREHGSSRDQ